MSNHLEKFVQANREGFDDATPDTRVWDKIQQKMNPREPEKVKPVVLSFKRWLSAAAVVIFLAGAGMMYLLIHREPTPPASIAARTKPVSTDIVKPDITTPKVDSLNQRIQPRTTAKTVIHPDKNENTSSTDEESEEMFHFARLVEIKHNELKRLEKDEPLLYRQFAGDVSRLDSVYHSLKIQLPKNSNREQVIEAMIQNLRLQIALLNRQLDIIKQINQSKKSAYEKAYKSA